MDPLTTLQFPTSAAIPIGAHYPLAILDLALKLGHGR